MFHFISFRSFTAIFAAASHILCDMNEIFSVWLNLNCGCILLYLLRFSLAYTRLQLCLCVCRCWCNFVVEMVSLSLFLLLLFLVLLQVSIALVDLRLENMLLQAHTVRVMAMPQKHRTVVNYAGKVMDIRNILPSRFITHCHGFVLTQLQFPLLLNTFSIERIKTIEQNERR